MRFTRLAVAFALVAIATSLAAASQAFAAAPSVYVFPSPGTVSALPGTQITFRGISSGAIGQIQVVGSKTGAHSGRIAADSDGFGGSFLPSTPFAPGETVTVTTGLNVVGGSNGSFHFTITNPWGTIGAENLPYASAGSNGVMRFHSRPDLEPAAISITQRSSRVAPGDIFVASQLGPLQDGPELLDPSGNLVWFDPLPRNVVASDFRVQRLFGKPVLTWWQGSMNFGSGRGVGEIYDTSYNLVKTVQAGNGLQGLDLHEFLVTNGGQAWVIAASPIHWGGMHRPLMDAVVQEIDVKTGLVLFEWHAFDHVPMSESFFKQHTMKGHSFDPWHLNSIAIDRDGNPIISMRNTWAFYKVDRHTGAVIWTLGSNRNSFKLGPGVRTAFQHNVVVQPDGTFTIFDDGAGPPAIHPASRAIRVNVDQRRKTATLIRQYVHAPPFVSIFEGGAQVLPNGDIFVGWGQQPYLTEFNSAGQQIFDARFVSSTPSYRAYRFQWSGQPRTRPDLAVSQGAGGVTNVYASWNGATDVSSWRVLAGADPGSLSPVATVGRHGFETAIGVHSEQRYFSVQALGSAGQTLASSAVADDGPSRVSIFGHSAFVSAGGVGGLFVGCFSPQTCHVTTTITVGRTVIARTGSEHVAAGDGGMVLFSLTGAGRSMLARARGGRLGVWATVQNSGGASNGTGLNLIPFRTSGTSPGGSAAQGRSVRVYGRTAFVSSSGVGGLFAGCFAAQPCHVVTTVTAGQTVIARTGREFIGAGDFGTLLFNLTSSGRAMLARANGNQLPVRITVSNGGDSASAPYALVGWR